MDERGADKLDRFEGLVLFEDLGCYEEVGQGDSEDTSSLENTCFCKKCLVDDFLWMTCGLWHG